MPTRACGPLTTWKAISTSCSSGWAVRAWVITGCVKAVLGQRQAHLLQSLIEFGGGKTGAGRQLAGALQLRIDGGALGAVHADRTDEGARRPAKDEGHAVLLANSLHLNGFKEAGRKELAQAPFQLFPAQGRSLGLGQMAGQRDKAIG